MVELNCFGDFCPIPLLRLQKALKALSSGDQILLITDHSCVVESVDDYLSKGHGICCTEEVMNGVWEITITKS